MVITTATSIHYGNYKHLFKTVKKLYDIIFPNTGHLIKLLNLPADINIHFRPIRNQLLLGQYCSINHCVEIDPRRGDFTEILTAVCHELVHAEQYHENRLSCDNKYFYWAGKKWKTSLEDSIYLNFPWEIEAYDRQAVIYNAALKNSHQQIFSNSNIQNEL